MAQQKGLFTGGTSVEELLAQRRDRSNALRTSLAANAAQGARNAPRAQTASMMGSMVADLIGRKMGGGDPQMEKLTAANAQQSQFEGKYSELLTSGTPVQQLQGAKDFISAGYVKEGTELHQASQAGFKAQKDQSQKSLDLSLEQEDAYEANAKLQENNSKMGESLKDYAPDLAALLMSGQSTDKHSAAGLAALADKRKQAEAKAKGGAAGGVAAFNVSLFAEERAKFDVALANGELSQYDYEDEIERLSTFLGASPNQGLKYRREQDYKSVNSYLENVTAISKGANKKIAQYEQSIRIIDNGDVYFGTGAEAIDALKKAAVSLGLADDAADIQVADAAQFRSNTMKSVLDTISQTKGTTTDTEMAIFKAAGPELSKTQAGNKLILTTALRVAEWEKAKSAAMHQWYVNNPKGSSRSSAKLFEKVWKENPNNKLKFPTASDIALASKPPVVLTGAESTVDIFSAYDTKFNEDETN